MRAEHGVERVSVIARTPAGAANRWFLVKDGERWLDGVSRKSMSL